MKVEEVINTEAGIVLLLGRLSTPPSVMRIDDLHKASGGNEKPTEVLLALDLLSQGSMRYVAIDRAYQSMGNSRILHCSAIRHTCVYDGCMSSLSRAG